MIDADRWESIFSPHTSAQTLKDAASPGTTITSDADFSFGIVNSTFKMKDYNAGYYLSGTFLFQFPRDTRRPDVYFIEGVCAFQTGRIDTALFAFNTYLADTVPQPLRGYAFYWRARCRLEQNDWQSAENDFRSCAEDSSVHTYRAEALLGWALALERHKEYPQAVDIIQQLLDGHPQGDLLSDAQIRLASLKLRLSDPHAALVILQDTKTPFHYQREESLLLRAEANFQMGLYDSALVRYNRFLVEFPESKYIRNARYGRAWANLRLGNVLGAQSDLDSIGSGNDTLAVTALYQNAMISLLNNDMKDASSRFDSLVDEYPYEEFSDNAYYQLGLIAYRGQHYRDARKYFELAARLYPESELRFQSYRMMGEACMALSDFSNAQYAFSQLRKLNAPDSILARAMFQEGVALYHLGRFRSGVDRFEEFLKKFPGSPLAPEGLVWKGESMYQDYRFDSAEVAFASAIRLYPTNPKREVAAYGVAWSWFEQKKFSEAVEAFDQFLKSYPQSEHKLEASLRKADCYYFLGDYAKAENEYAVLAGEKSEGHFNEYAAFQIAMSYIQRGDADRGMEQLRSFLARFPSSIYCEVVQFNIAWTYFSKDQFPNALTEFRTFLKQYPLSQLLPRVYFNMGDAFYNTKAYDSARVYYKEVLDQFPQSPLAADALSGLEFAYRSEGKSSEALTVIENYVHNKSSVANDEELLLKKGDIFFDQADFPSAIQQYQQVLTMKPSSVQRAKAFQQIGRAYELENNLSQAITFYRQVVDSFPNAEAAPSVALSLGLAYVKTKHYAQAKEVFESFDGTYTDTTLLPEVRFQLGMTLLAMKDTTGGFQELQVVVQRHSEDIFAERSRLQLAKLHEAKKQYQASLDTLEGVVTRRNDDLAAEALLIMGDDYLQMKRNGDALQAFLDVIEQYTEYGLLVERAKLGAGESYIHLSEKKKAKKLYQEIVDSPVDPEMKKIAQERLRKLR